MTLEKWFDGILMLWTVLSLFCYSPPYPKSRYPRFLRNFDRYVTFLWLAIAPIAAYKLFMLFRSAQPGSRFAIAFLALIILIGMAARWWTSQNKSAPSQS